MSPAVVSDLAHAIICFLGRTTEIRSENEEYWRRTILGDRQQVVLAFWHNQILLVSYYLATRYVWQGMRASAMISASRDGEYLAKFFTRFGVGSVRGSTTRGGRAALVGMMRRAREGDCLALTPDGPLGPIYRAQSGVMHLAKATGLPICPVAGATNRFVTFRSWDRFTLPLPFARASIVFGPPIRVASDLDDEALEEKRRELEMTLNDATALVYRRVGRPVPRP